MNSLRNRFGKLQEITKYKIDILLVSQTKLDIVLFQLGNIRLKVLVHLSDHIEIKMGKVYCFRYVQTSHVKLLTNIFLKRLLRKIEEIGYYYDCVIKIQI